MEPHASDTAIAELDAPAFGKSLRGFGINLLVSDVLAMNCFLTDVLGCVTVRANVDFAILRYGTHLIQLHGDGTYHSNPLPSLLPELGARGAGVELRFYETDPDEAEAKASAVEGCSILQSARNKPHGLREVYIVGPDGYCFVPSRHLTARDGIA